MMRSMYAGVAGLRNHQTRMDVIGNNMANVNTAGYKKGRVVFKDTLYQNIRGASNPTGVRGGTNPMAVGLGMSVASIDQIHTPSPATVTNKLTDMAIDGNGYFMVNNGGEQFFTRSGAFDFDKVGNLVMTSNGFYVQGWMADPVTGNIDTTTAAQKIDISGYKTVKPNATTQMRFSGNLNSNLDAGWENDPSKININNATVPTGYTTFDTANSAPNNAIVMSKDIFDSLGNKETVYFRYYKVWDNAPDQTDASYQWYCDISLDPQFSGAIGDYNETTGTYPESDVIRVENITFNTDGSLNTSGTTSINLIVNREAFNADNIEFTVDLNLLTQYESKSTAWAEFQDGYTMGNLTSYSVGSDGSIFGVYDNGESRNLARVALANFENSSGLLQAGSSLFRVSNNSGDPRIGAPGEQGMGAILPGSLEMSNVDLSEEFTDMIVTQRGFQANSRLITTSDEMLQELVNLKR